LFLFFFLFLKKKKAGSLTCLAGRWNAVVSPATIDVDLEDDDGGDVDAKALKSKFGQFLVGFIGSCLTLCAAGKRRKRAISVFAPLVAMPTRQCLW
jgi:hypothetical protein